MVRLRSKKKKDEDILEDEMDEMDTPGDLPDLEVPKKTLSKSKLMKKKEEPMYQEKFRAVDNFTMLNLIFEKLDLVEAKVDAIQTMLNNLAE